MAEYRFNGQEMEEAIKLSLLSTPDVIISNPELVPVIMSSFSNYLFSDVDDDFKVRALKLYDDLVKLGKQREDLLNDFNEPYED